MKASLQAFHIQSAFGNLAVIYFTPDEGMGHSRDIVFIHGFAHELPVAKPVMASIWRRLAADGIGVLSIDLPGCGDSAGDFGDATWENWLAAVETAHQWLSARSDRPIHAAGLRIGAMLALETSTYLPWKSILLLQPVIRGQELMTQFLRVLVAFSGLRSNTTEKETTQSLRARIATGEKLEIGGYFLPPELAMKIDGMDLDSFKPPPGCPIAWVETGIISPAASLTAEKWGVSIARLDVKPYWVHTRGLVPEYAPLAEEVARILSDGR